MASIHLCMGAGELLLSTVYYNTTQFILLLLQLSAPGSYLLLLNLPKKPDTSALVVT